MNDDAYHRVLLCQDSMRCICSFQCGMDGVVKYLHEATKSLLDRLNDGMPWSMHHETYESYQQERLDVICKLYDDFFKPWYSAYKAVQLLSAAYLFKPMPEFMAISTCDVSGHDSLYIQRR
ncbi:hypothetical protein Ae201684P_014924 [Aphanomyces euteiches]|uniref:Uncharacterized protein n=1 Tax=Aphanomyces euteiches TaxID=100861 RepID=A0A6G0WY71_9STRA|nr:hypothetical protein Ae201684_010448 [Aphanomyces euteiches]KAH9090175.1 hypothetical protein Ae201684P_014924 [Aphanomyces euteiches]KAH9138591.1 hypothetical protein AeRB84_017102 [Aphanomyces euteiches]